MAVVLKKLWIAYDLISEQLPDPRTKSWPLVFKPHECLTIVAVYVLFVLKWGPKWMETRPPYNINKLLILHNIIQVAFCGYIFYESLAYAWIWDYRWVCEPIDYTDNVKSLRVAGFVYHYYLSKYLDLLDTVFFVLRKKFNQVSLLHVFHHSNMVVASWIGVTYIPGGHGTFVILLNSFVHLVMYSYYLLTTLRPNTKRSVWWKKYLTQLQIVQVAMIFSHASLAVITPNCLYPAWLVMIWLPSNLFFLCLFVDFYIKTYIKNKASSTNEYNTILHKKINTEGKGEVNYKNLPTEKSELRQRSEKST